MTWSRDRRRRYLPASSALMRIGLVPSSTNRELIAPRPRVNAVHAWELDAGEERAARREFGRQSEVRQRAPDGRRTADHAEYAAPRPARALQDVDKKHPLQEVGPALLTIAPSALLPDSNTSPCK